MCAFLFGSKIIGSTNSTFFLLARGNRVRTALKKLVDYPKGRKMKTFYSRFDYFNIGVKKIKRTEQ